MSEVDQFTHMATPALRTSPAPTIKHDSQALQTVVAALQGAEQELAEFASDLTARRLLGTPHRRGSDDGPIRPYAL